MARDRAARAECAHCHTTQSVKRDGTLFKHTIYVDWQHVQCPGAGKPPKP